jgi:hypothetical protein
VNHQLESRVRENRSHGSEGGGAGYTTGPSYPYIKDVSAGLMAGGWGNLQSGICNLEFGPGGWGNLIT